MDEFDLYADLTIQQQTQANEHVKPQAIQEKKPDTRPAVNASLQPPPPGASIFISNLQWWTTDVELERIASAAAQAPVLGVRFIEDKSCGKSRGMAIVDFATPAAAQGAIQALNGTTIDGRPVRVTIHQERSAQAQAPGTAAAPPMMGVPSVPMGAPRPPMGIAAQGGARGPPMMMGMAPPMMGMPGMMFPGMVPGAAGFPRPPPPPGPPANR